MSNKELPKIWRVKVAQFSVGKALFLIIIRNRFYMWILLNKRAFYSYIMTQNSVVSHKNLRRDTIWKLWASIVNVNNISFLYYAFIFHCHAILVFLLCILSLFFSSNKIYGFEINQYFGGNPSIRTDYSNILHSPVESLARTRF